MKRGLTLVVLLAILFLAFPLQADERDRVVVLGESLLRSSADLAEESYDHFRGWNGEINDQEQAVLFRSESFSASARLFLKLAQDKGGYFRDDSLRTNLFNAFSYLVSSFEELSSSMDRKGLRMSSLRECRRTLEEMERAFSRWPSRDNPAYLQSKYVKGRGDRVYLIERRGTGDYRKRVFRNLESLYAYNYGQKRGKDPWKYLEKVPEETLDRMEEGEPIGASFEGRMVIAQGRGANRAVYLIEGGRKRAFVSPQPLARYGGWDKVLEVPPEIIESYGNGEPIQ